VPRVVHCRAWRVSASLVERCTNASAGARRLFGRICDRIVQSSSCTDERGSAFTRAAVYSFSPSRCTCYGRYQCHGIFRSEIIKRANGKFRSRSTIAARLNDYASSRLSRRVKSITLRSIYPLLCSPQQIFVCLEISILASLASHAARTKKCLADGSNG